METAYSVSRDALIGRSTHWKACALGIVQQRHDYEPMLLECIHRKACEIRQAESEKRHLNLQYIRAAHQKIPEIAELMESPARLARLGRLAGTRIEPYPVSVIASTITFMGAAPGEGTVDWHADGVPMTELIPLCIHPHTRGGELLVYKGDCDHGMALLDEGCDLPQSRILHLQHRVGFSTFGQFLRVLHRTAPITTGHRITLNLNVRSAERPYVDDNSLCYLGADNPDFAWEEEMLRDVKDRQLPTYLANA